MALLVARSEVSYDGHMTLEESHASNVRRIKTRESETPTQLKSINRDHLIRIVTFCPFLKS